MTEFRIASTDGVDVGVAVDVGVGVSVAVPVGVPVGVGVSVGVPVDVPVGVGKSFSKTMFSGYGRFQVIDRDSFSRSRMIQVIITKSD